MKIRIKYPFSLVVLTTLLLLAGVSCTTTRKVTDTKDLSYIYNPLKSSINPRFGVLNNSESSSVLTIKFFNSDLYFNEANPTGKPLAQLMVSIRLYNITLGRTLADTAQMDYDIVKDPAKMEYLIKVPLSVEKGIEYIAEVKIFDKIRQFSVQSFIPFNTKSDFNRYNFYARGHLLKNELLLPVVRKDDYFNVVYSRAKPDSINISFFRPDLEIPYPPSMVLPERPAPVNPDTTLRFHYSDTMPLMLPLRGIYLISLPRHPDEGFSFFNFGSDYPNVTTPGEMIEPLAYLTSPDEYTALRNSQWPKVALDEFWLKCGGNVEKARELIRIYYTRVMYANYYFSSYKEGWRTDRGMVYIIYGPPDKLYKSANEETWGYVKPEVKSSWGTRYKVKEEYLFFTFRKKDNLFSDNEYSLSRSETVVSFWDRAILSWRKGIVFRLDNPEDI
ncbi:MAG: GWxTD domain-containing protein [Bacteroidales bacterium]